MNISEAIQLYLKHYPGSNKDEFLSTVDAEAERDAVRAIIDETTALPIDMNDKSLIEIGEAVQVMLHERHPDLSPEALHKLSNYFCYLVK